MAQAKRKRAKRLTCKNGHRWIEGQYELQANGSRSCLVCFREKQAMHLKRLEEGKLEAEKRVVLRRPAGTCRNGHSMIEAYEWVTPGRGMQRQCRQCKNMQSASTYLATKEEKAEEPTASEMLGKDFKPEVIPIELDELEIIKEIIENNVLTIDARGDMVMTKPMSRMARKPDRRSGFVTRFPNTPDF
jgi:hypothetical protein